MIEVVPLPLLSPFLLHSNPPTHLYKHSGALAFLASLLVIFTTQNSVRGKAYRGGWESLADLYVEVSKGMLGLVWRKGGNEYGQ